jgi:two-component system nitrogen regulation response regulator NtrX
MNADVLVVDDESDICLQVSGILEDEGYKVVTAQNSDAALDALSAAHPKVVILDVWLERSRLDGLQLINEILEEAPQTVILMMSGHADIDTAVRAIRDGAYNFVEKPFSADRMIIAVARAYEAANLRAEVAHLKEANRKEWHLIGNSPAMLFLRSQIEKLAKVNSRILIQGPSGSGKEVIARCIHATSDRVGAPFSVLSCAAVRPDNMEAMLFGEQTPDGLVMPGMLADADGGVVLLDEIADLPIEAQAKMLRFIQEGAFTPVGASQPVSVDIRVMASSSRDLQKMVREGTLREDLYFRLNVVPIKAPSLSERVDDIPALAEHFINSAVNDGQQIRRLSAGAISALQAHTWPGNVRQLRNVVEWLLIMAPGTPHEEIGVDALPPDILGEDPTALLDERREELMEIPLKDAREAFERSYLSAQIKRFGGNVSRTAKAVGMERSALHRKLKSLNLGEGT